MGPGTIITGIIGFIWCILFISYFTWFSDNYVYTYTSVWDNKIQHKILIPRYFYILYGIFMFIPIVNLMMVVICTFLYEIQINDGWTKYHYIGKNKFILKYIDIKNKIKIYLTMKV